MVKKKTTDWAAMIGDVQDKYLLSQTEIATVCGVAQQTVSSWKTGIRNPGFRAKRKILQLIAEKKSYSNSKGYTINGVPAWQVSERLLAGVEGNSDEGNSELVSKFNSLSKQEQKQVMEFCDYLLNKSRVK